jgi:cell wall-active antibiotic response 4TMS protein YvqF
MSDEGIRWGRLARGFYLVGFGTFLLLTTQDILPWSFWRDVLAFWPVFLVAIGIRMLFERSPARALVLLGPLLVLGTMMYVARRGPVRADAWQDWLTLRADRPAGISSWTLEGRLAMASLDVGSRRLPRGLLVEGRGTEAGSRSVRIAEDTAADRVRVTNSWSKGAFLVLPGASRARCELGVTPTLPVALDLDLAFTTTRLDIAAAPVTGAAVDGAFNDLSLRLGEPSSEVRLRLEGAFNQVTIEVPSTTPVSVNSEGFLNFVEQRREDRGRADGGPDRAPGYRLRLRGAFNRVVVRSW